MDTEGSGAAEFDAIVGQQMEALFRYPGSGRKGLIAAREVYRRELSAFQPIDLARGWKRIVASHKSPWWPSVAALLSACRAEYLHRALTELGRSLPASTRRPWIAARKRLFLAAAASGFSRRAVGQALSQAGRWIKDQAESGPVSGPTR